MLEGKGKIVSRAGYYSLFNLEREASLRYFKIYECGNLPHENIET
jgi:hypothetical protein